MTMNDLIKTVANAYKNPSEGEADRNGNTRLSILQEKFHLSSLKVQKILVTAGVYESVKADTPYAEITQLHKAGKSVKEIMEITGLSSAAVSAYLPYERSVYNADRSGAGISSAAARKRKQRGDEETKRMHARSSLQEDVTDEIFWKAIQEHSRETFISTEGEKYPAKALMAFPKDEVLDVLHNALELMAAGKDTDVQSFDQAEVLPYVYPLLVFFGIIPGDMAQYTTRRMPADPAVCSCCGRRADYTVNTYADLIDIAAEIEEEERGKWDPAERERVEREEASFGRVSWHDRAKKSTAAILAFDREGERHFCTLCAQTIRMALEDGELPHSTAPADFRALSLEAAEAGFDQYYDRMPAEARYQDRFGNRYDADTAGHEDVGQIFLYKEKDKDGIEHTFACFERKFPGHRMFEAVEVHKLTKGGRLARDYTGTDYEFRTGMWEDFDVGRDGDEAARVWTDDLVGAGGDEAAAREHLRMTYIGFLELANHVRNALRNPTLEWHKGFPYLSNAVDIGNRQCMLGSIGEMEVVWVDNMPGGGRKSAQDRTSVQGREWHGGKYGFMIDGRIFTGEEVALMSSGHEGWKLQYRFADPSDQPLQRGEYLMPVQLGEKELVTETSELLNLFTSDGRFISEHDEKNFGILFEKEVLKKLKLYHESNPRGYGKLAGMQVIKRLKWIEGTGRQVEQVREVIQM